MWRNMSVGLSVRKVYCGKTAEWIRMPLGTVGGVGWGMGVLDGGRDRRRWKGSFRGDWGRPIVTNGDFATRFFPNYFGQYLSYYLRIPEIALAK